MVTRTRVGVESAPAPAPAAIGALPWCAAGTTDTGRVPARPPAPCGAAYGAAAFGAAPFGAVPFGTAVVRSTTALPAPGNAAATVGL
ncbi:hypothetical protein GCM10009738_50370 [Kitasatospora viridis]